MTEWVKSVDSFPVSIYVAGEIVDARRLCREFCFNVGLCVTVTACDFIYTGGAESGVRVGLVHYPRFPSSPGELLTKAEDLARHLMTGLSQWSALVETPERTVWLTRRPEAA